jgi:DNA polymerase I-like protein with 3'-5' exonuclease and polymerase domains
MAKIHRLNAQGLARRYKNMMSAIKAHPGETIVSIDLSAGEPTVTTHFSGDKNYRWATLDGIGKAPEYHNGVLLIDDVYLMTASVSPMHAQIMIDALKRDWGGKSFQQQWLEDSEVIKAALKSHRQVCKILALGIGYGMQPRKMVKQMYDQGYDLSLNNATAFFNNYWELFKDVKRLSNKLSNQVKSDGYLINPFGFRMTPEPRKAFNYFIQSSVSGIMHVYLIKLMSIAPYARFISVIHDELLMSVPDHLLEQFRIDSQLATKSLNDDLQWTVNIRTGFAPGKNWYESK